MSLLPIGTELGKVQIREVYLYHDGPWLFMAENELEQRFLAVCVEETGAGQRWFYSPVSAARLAEIRAGSVDLHHAYVAAETGHVANVWIPKGAEPATIIWVPCTSLLTTELPEPGVALSLEYAMPGVAPDQLLQGVADSSLRDVVILRIAAHDEFRAEAPSVTVGYMIQAFQYLLESLGQYTLGKATARGQIPASVRDGMQFNVAGLTPGSVRIELRSRQAQGLFPDLSAGQALNELWDLLSLKSDPELLEARAQQLGARACGRYRGFLEGIQEEVDVVGLQWATPRGRSVRQVEIRPAEARDILAVLRKATPTGDVEFELTAILIGLNARTWTFELWDPREKQKYVGKVADDARGKAGNAVINAAYAVQLREHRDLLFDGEERAVYQLLALDPLGRDSD